MICIHYFHITAVYKYCCRGVFCPGCTVQLTFHVLGMDFAVYPSLHMSCEKEFFNATVDTLVQPGMYDMKVRGDIRKVRNEIIQQLE